MESTLDHSENNPRMKDEKEEGFPKCDIKTEIDFCKSENDERESMNQYDVNDSKDEIKPEEEEKKFKFHVKVEDVNEDGIVEIKKEYDEDSTENYTEFMETEELILKNEENFDWSKTENGMFQLHYSVINGTPIPMGSAGRAVLTLPKGTLELRPSPMDDLGIYALMNFQKGVQFGPYEGKLAKVESTEGCSWRLKKGRLVDESDEANSNYLRYLNYARDISEQNLVAFQCNRELFYRTCREVVEGEELLIYLGEGVADAYYQPPKENLGKEIYKCQYCHVGLRLDKHRDTHEKYCQFRDSKMENDNRKTQNEPVGSVENHPSDSRNFSEKRKGNLNFHHRKSLGKNLLKCTDCDYETYDKPNMHRHKHIKHVRKNLFKCSECDYETHYKPNMDRHKSIKHEGKNLLKCADCDYQTYYKSNIYWHKCIKHERNNLFKCTDCDYETYHKPNMHRHKSIKHERKNVFRCTDCDYEAYDKSSMSRHKSVKHERKNFVKCTDCDYETYDKSSMIRHKIRKHGQKILIKCADCDYETYNIISMNYHAVKHDQKNLLKCTDCDYETYYKTNLKKHKIVKHEQKNR